MYPPLGPHSCITSTILVEIIIIHKKKVNGGFELPLSIWRVNSLYDRGFLESLL